VDERQFDQLMEQRQDESPPPFGSGSVAVECNGYAAGRGSGWVSFQATANAANAATTTAAAAAGGLKKKAAKKTKKAGAAAAGASGGGGGGGGGGDVDADDDDAAAALMYSGGVQVVRFLKNKTGIHVVELEEVKAQGVGKGTTSPLSPLTFKLLGSQTFNLYKVVQRGGGGVCWFWCCCCCCCEHFF
jgi:hypothetical protein